MRAHRPSPTSAKTKSCTGFALDVLDLQQACVRRGWGGLYLFVLSGPHFLRPVLFCTALPGGTCVRTALVPYLPEPKAAPGSHLMFWTFSRHVCAVDGEFCIFLGYLGPIS